MQFAYSEEQDLLRSTIRRFLEQRHPLASQRRHLEEPVTFDREVWEEGAQIGWTALLAPASAGGGGVSDQPVVDVAAVAEELGRQLYPAPVLPANLAADILAREGDEEQRKRHLAPIVLGSVVPAWCASGDGTPSLDAVAVQTREVDGDLQLDGVARFVHDAHIADLLLVTCTSARGPSLVLVPRLALGVTTRPMVTLDLTRRFCEVHFDGVTVPADAVVGRLGGATEAVERAQQLATVIQAAEAVGAAERLYEMTVQYAKDRSQFGRPIGSFQAVKHRLADLFVELEAARAAARYAALALADDREDRDEAVAVAGSYVRDAAAHIAGEALQLHGGIGFTWEHDVHLFLRRAKTDQVLYGEPWWHRERLCALVDASVPVDA